jgi:phosphoglycerate-specific signal transduction histidine kinase
MNKLFVLRDEYDMDSPVLLTEKDYVAALEEALMRLGKYIVEVDEDQAEQYADID